MALFGLFTSPPRLPVETGRVIDFTTGHRGWGHDISFGAPGHAIGWGGVSIITPELARLGAVENWESGPMPGDVILHEFENAETKQPYVARLLVVERDYSAMQGVNDGWGITYANLGPQPTAVQS